LYSTTGLKFQQFFYKERRMAEKISVPLFLTEAQLQTSTPAADWRNGTKASSGSIFRTPRTNTEFPNVFQHSVKREVVKQLPFAYKPAKPTKPTQAKPKIAIPEDEEEPAYAPKTP